MLMATAPLLAKKKSSGRVLTYDESGCIRSETNYVDGVYVGPIQTD
jgi:antitoxin component YwqK of YwqJK toxin-antitoxin module